jgi:hypothetical protein
MPVVGATCSPSGLTVSVADRDWVPWGSRSGVARRRVTAGAIILSTGNREPLGKRIGRERQHDGISVAIHGPNEDRGRDHLDVGEARLRQALLDPLLERLHALVHDILLVMNGARVSSLSWSVLCQGRYHRGKGDDCGNQQFAHLIFLHVLS